MTDKEKYEYYLHCACVDLKSLDERQHGLINGNFSFHAKKHKVKVKDLKQTYQKYIKSI